MFRQVLVAMRGRNLITGLVLPITVAIAVGIAVVVAAGVNNGSGGIAPAQLPAGFPPARAATGDFTAAPAVAGHGVGSAARVAVNAIAASGSMQVAAGSANGVLALWSSADGGSTWARGTGATARALTAAGTVTGVAHGRAGWVAVGGPAAAGASPGIATPAPEHPVVLGSAGGRTWAAQEGAAAFTGPGLVTSSVAAGSGGYVIVGWRQGGGHQAGKAWFSARLAGWQPAVLSLTGGDTKLAAVTSTGSGFVAAGSAGASPAAWISPNGKAWRQVTLPLPASARAASLRYVAAAGGTVAAVGSAVTGAGSEIPFGVISGDGGVTWHESALPAPVSGPASLTVTALAAAGQGYTATGTFGSPGDQDVVIWTSDPGTSGWTAAAPAGYGLSGAGAQAITALAAAGSTLTGAGFTVMGGTEAPTIWQSPIRG